MRVRSQPLFRNPGSTGRLAHFGTRCKARKITGRDTPARRREPCSMGGWRGATWQGAAIGQVTVSYSAPPIETFFAVQTNYLRSRSLPKEQTGELMKYGDDDDLSQGSGRHCAADAGAVPGDP